MTINPAQRTSTQTQFSNDSAVAEQFTVKVVAWTMQDGKDVYTPSRDLIVNPSSFTVQPGQTQVIRIGLLKKPGDTELAYRVIITQIPRDDAPVSKETVKDVVLNVRRAVAFGLAVYITPPNAAPRTTAQAMREGPDLLITVKNAGARHQLIDTPAFAADGRTLTLASAAVLSGATQTLRLKGWGALQGPLTFTYRDVNGEVKNETLALP
jgi:fimbrial chaperone protein